MNTNEAFEKLKEAGVTDNIQTVRRWLREGEIKATRSEYRKAGFDISYSSLISFIDKRTGMYKEIENKELSKSIDEIYEQNSELEIKIWKLEKENKELKEKVPDYEDDFSKRVNRLSKNLHPCFKELEYQLDLDIAEWLSLFSINVQNKIRDIDLSYRNCKQIRERSSFYDLLINYSAITGKQMNRYIELTVSLEGRLFNTNKEIDNQLVKGSTKDEIDSLLDQLEELIIERKNEGSKQSNYDWSKLFSNIAQNNINYREKLGLSSNVTDSEVKKEFKRVLKILHPDHGGNAKLFQEYKTMYDDFRKKLK
ncbi:hypothetical protein [Aquibacillus kalidii]|uniref:hypothetical protein n=1 Tax=Aquibacillus kalidii TaxID=2762597 RepID=UPI001648A0BE|nr:hypothetical protein [Aquibacillus kalidii]